MEENAPYITNLWKIRDILNTCVTRNSITTTENMIPVIEDLISETEYARDITVETDLRIILNWLEKRKHQN